MAVPISEIIDVKIDLTNPQIAEQDFSTPLIFSKDVSFTDASQIVSVFSSPTELIETNSPIKFQGRAMKSTDAPYIAASKFYSTAKSKFLVGGPLTKSSGNITSDTSSTDIAAVDGSTGTTPAANATAVDEVTPSLNKISEFADFYFLIATDRDIVESCANWTQTNSKMFFFSTDAAGSIAAPNTASPDILQTLYSQKFTRSAGLFSKSQDKFPEAVWIGTRANDEPGSSVWAYSELPGIASDDLSTFQYKQVLSRNANTYVNIAKRDVILKGQVFSGQYIDEIISTDYLKFQIERAFFSLLLTKKKIPYTDEGITIVAESLIRVLDSAKRYILESYTLKVPSFADISPQDRASRILKISVAGVQKGAIQQGSINLTIGFGG